MAGSGSGPDVYGRSARRGPGRQRRHSRRHGGVGQRGDGAVARGGHATIRANTTSPRCQPGTYTVKATLTGFKTYENKGVRIGAQQFITLDIALEVGQLQETITVTGQAPLIDTSNASTGAVIDSQQLQTLPSVGRSAFLFAVTVPTVIASGDAQFNRQQDQTNASLLSLGGGTRRGNNYLVDGVPITDMRNRASANPTIEALEEVNVQVHTYDAETGRTGGGTFNVATKSGTNDWHGSGFYQNRPKWGATNNFFSELAGQPKPGDLLPPGRRRLRRPDHPQPHVLLGRDRRLRIEHDAQRRAALPDQPRAARRLLADASTRTASSSSSTTR